MLGTTSLQFARRNTKARRSCYDDRRNSSRGGGGSGGSPAMLEESEEVLRKASLGDFGGRLSNLDRFLDATMPFVTARCVSEVNNKRMRGWRTCDAEYSLYFSLGDLWESFKEWSAYGAGVPLLLNGHDCAVQYYVPYLSGIQLYGEYRQPGKTSDIDCYRDSSSDGSSDCELENDLKYARDWNCMHLLHGSTFGMDGLSMRENCAMQEGFSSDDSDGGISQGRLLFQYLERNPPYSREPLADKVSDLASQFPGLRTLSSYDLLPSSWISVAWYPIYRIPTGRTLKDLDACFLTYHSLSTPMQGANAASGVNAPKIPLPCFGMASYKFKGSLWTNSNGCEIELANSLLHAADNWLQLLSVDHPDYMFFRSHGAFRR